MVKAAEARLKKVDEWHLDFAQGEGFNFHVNFSQYIQSSSHWPSRNLPFPC